MEVEEDEEGNVRRKVEKPDRKRKAEEANMQEPGLDSEPEDEMEEDNEGEEEEKDEVMWINQITTRGDIATWTQKGGSWEKGEKEMEKVLRRYNETLTLASVELGKLERGNRCTW